jgi:hypothetical protein
MLEAADNSSATNLSAMAEQTIGQMQWQREGEEQCLHLRLDTTEPWRPYEEFPEYVKPDPAGFSKGITTFIALFRQGWVTVKS